VSAESTISLVSPQWSRLDGRSQLTAAQAANSTSLDLPQWSPALPAGVRAHGLQTPVTSDVTAVCERPVAALAASRCWCLLKRVRVA
jgi:hypothetical protein